MQYRLLGKTGLEVSTISMGCWGIGGQWGPVEESQALQTIRRAVEVGITLFDTADAYGMEPGYSEEVVGKALHEIRGRVLIATKVGNFARRFGHPLPYTTPHHIYLCCDASLYRLRRDVIDLYQCHIGGLEDPTLFLEAFERLKERGKIRAYGISTNDLDALRRFNQQDTCGACQLDYSLLNRTPEQDILPYCQEQNIGTLIRGPLGMGVLTGKFTPQTVFTDEVRQGWNDEEGRERFLKRLSYAERVRFVERPGRTLAQAALQFVLAHPAVSCAIPGAKSPEQAEANAKAADGSFTAEEMERINRTGTM